MLSFLLLLISTVRGVEEGKKPSQIRNKKNTITPACITTRENNHRNGVFSGIKISVEWRGAKKTFSSMSVS